MTAKKERIHILIADDHSVVREGLVSLVKRKPDMKVVAEASNGREAVDLWKEHRPDGATDLGLREASAAKHAKNWRLLFMMAALRLVERRGRGGCSAN